MMTENKKRHTKQKLNKKDLLALYTTMLRIRRVEETLMDIFSSGEIPGFLHVCIGQEAAPAAICSLLDTADYMGTTHRGHGHALAKGIGLKGFIAEILGKKDGFCMGRSGSMHLAEKDVGILGANGIVGGGLPIATGAALAAQYKYPGRIAVCFFGDGATSQGTFHECLNMASLWKLPVVYVCENNGWAEFSPQRVHMPVEDISIRATAYNIPAVTIPNDTLEIYEAAATAINRARQGNGPTLLEIKCNRWYGHFVGDQQKYRDQAALAEARTDDCLKKLEKDLLKNKILSQAKISKIDRQIKDEITEAVTFARNSPAPAPAELAAGLYV